MAGKSNRTRKTTRFSLLLLEDGEVLLSDLAVQYHFVSDSPLGSALHPLSSYPERFALRSANASIRGRVKTGTRNIFFDSDDWRDPVIRIPLVSVDLVRPTRDNSRSRGSDDGVIRAPLSDDIEDENSVLVMASSAVFQRELGTDHPYIDVQLKGKHIFTPLYTSSVQLLDEIASLLQITASQSRRGREECLRALVREREARVPFDITLLEHGTNENAMMDAAASAVYAMSRAPGRFRITEHNLYFMPIHGDSAQAVERISTSHISSVRRLHHGCRNAALEVGFKEMSNSSHPESLSTLMVSFESVQVREKAISILLNVVEEDVEMYDRRELETALNRWRNGEMSNFDYLMYLNMAAGRSFNDLSQYPVFPWVLKDYESERLDLTDEKSFRNLSLPIGAMTAKRLEAFRERYNEMPSPRFFYGTHYSTPAYTINYLVRAAPGAMLRLQNGKFDTPDRLFHSVLSTWKGVLSNQGDVKELIPEFYTLDYSSGNASGVVSNASSPGEFLDNVLGLELGLRQDGKRVDDVELPLWANGSSELFIRRHREALECDYVSSKLHNWIDLIFGVKSRSADACNVFYTDVALPSSINSEEVSKLSGEEISQIETVYLEFGRTPEKLFGHPHPPRFGDIYPANFDEGSSPQNDALEGLEPSLTGPSTEDGVGGNSELTTKVSETPLDISNLLEDSSDQSDVDQRSAKSGGPVNFWGSRSRRRDSVLVGASDPILFPFQPAQNESEKRDVQEILVPYISHVVRSTNGAGNGHELLDVCLVQGEQNHSKHGADLTGDVESPVICTIWSDGNLKVYSERRLLRSKHIGDVSSITYVSTDIVGFGTLAGCIGLYYIDSGRLEVILQAAHDAEVCALEYIEGGEVLISGSKDASVKVWTIDNRTRRVADLHLLQELDAESCIDDVCATMQTSESDSKMNLLVAVSTTDGQLMAWEINLVDSDQDFLEPIWRSEVDISTSVPDDRPTGHMRKLTWLYQGTTRRHALASVHPGENCVRVWNLDQTRMAAAEVFVSEGDAGCIARCDASRTVLVGGSEGRISEYDSTGLALGKVTAGANDVRNILLPDRGGCMYLFAGRDEILRVVR